MINFCLNENERVLLKSLIGKKVLYFKHDSFEKFESETVYGRIELIFDDLVILIQYDYELYPLFGGDDDHPKFSVRSIKIEEAVSELENTKQIEVNCGRAIKGIDLIEDYVKAEWNGKIDDVRMMKGIIFKFNDGEIAIQGDYMIPLLDIFKGNNLLSKIGSQADEFEDEETKYETKRFVISL